MHRARGCTIAVKMVYNFEAIIVNRKTADETEDGARWCNSTLHAMSKWGWICVLACTNATEAGRLQSLLRIKFDDNYDRRLQKYPGPPLALTQYITARGQRSKRGTRTIEANQRALAVFLQRGEFRAIAGVQPQEKAESKRASSLAIWQCMYQN